MDAAASQKFWEAAVMDAVASQKFWEAAVMDAAAALESTIMNVRDAPRLHIAHRLLRARDWQDRDQLRQVRDWWRSGQRGGVCALVGIGGAGKTAIADRFVRGLPGVLPTDGISEETTLRPPSALFVFSFYDAPNADSFFAELYSWLCYAPESDNDENASYERTVRRLEKEDDVLLVLDGLEKIQDTGDRSGYFGRILDGRLRDFVLRVTEGWMPGVRLLITTRFRLFDALAERSPHFRQILVEQLTPEASVALLRQRGVSGPDHELQALARGQGFHALSVDLLGGYVAHFFDGDPSRLKPEVDVPVDAGVDPRIAAVREQERRFARLAERYTERLGWSDPAALALLQRVCLFRLGIDAGTLASIFLGDDKEDVAGAELARLDETGVRAKLSLLVEMKLLEKDENERYNVHPAVRDGFLKSLDAETSLRGHEAAREGLELSLGGQPGDNPSDPATLDLLEEIVHHTLAAGHVQEAWNVYWNRIGEYKNLGWRLGAYERGERICRAFAGGRPPEEAPLPEGLSEDVQANFINGWALYLVDLGRLDGAVRCYDRHNELRMRQRDWENASTGRRNLTDVLLLAGRLTAASDAAEETLRLAERANSAWGRYKSYAFRAHVRALRGEVADALADFRDALHWQHDHDEKQDRPLWSIFGVFHTLLLVRLSQNEEATRLAEANDRICSKVVSEEYDQKSIVFLVLADLARERHDLDAARHLLDAAHEWALARDAKEHLCWASLVRARIAHDADDHETARTAVEDGLRIARDCGFGIYHIDLLLLRGRLALEAGDADAALADASVALFDGVQPPEASGLPVLLAATDPECGYAWGEGDGRQLRGEALLFQAARWLGRPDFAPGRWDDLPEDVRGLIDEVRSELETCRQLREKIQDPKAAETVDVLRQLDGGVLMTEDVFRRCNEPTEGEDMSDEALKIYQEKLKYFEKSLATTSDTAQRFSLESSIQEIKDKIRDLGGVVPLTPAKPVAPATETAGITEPGTGPVDVGIIVALEEEFDELHSQLPSPTPVKNEGAGSYDYLFERPVEGAEPYRCAATFVGEMGPTDAALAAERFLKRRGPRTLVMLGIAAGINDDVKLGDVVVAKSVGRYLDNAKIVDGAGNFEIRPGGDSFPCSHDLVESAQHLKYAHPSIYRAWTKAGVDDLLESVPEHAALVARKWLSEEPAFIKGQIASGPVVAAAKEFVDWVRSMNRKYLALEMEGGGVLAAVYQSADPAHSLVLRGISDFGDQRKKELDALGEGGLRRYAMRNAVRLLWALLEARALPRKRTEHLRISRV